MGKGKSYTFIFLIKIVELVIQRLLEREHREHQKENACRYRTLGLAGPGLAVYCTCQAFSAEWLAGWLVGCLVGWLVDLAVMVQGEGSSCQAL